MPILDTLNPDNLLAGDFPRVTQEVTILTGNTPARGTALGKITASGKCVAVDSGASDGSEELYAVLAEDVDASAADAVGVAWLTGEFNEDALTFGGTDTKDDHRDAARTLSIFFKAPVSA